MLTINKSEFFKSFSKYNDIPNSHFSEIAFVGRSNVGKSTLINDLASRKIAKVSSEPGKTRLINFFLINNSFYFVDLPGYGYAKASKEIKKDWPELIESYLENRKQLKTIIFILDIRRTPAEHDITINEYLKQRSEIKTIYILSKADKLNLSEKNKQIKIISEALNINKDDLILYSVPEKKGKKELLSSLNNSLEK
jgi:GTP-binding protein